MSSIETLEITEIGEMDAAEQAEVQAEAERLLDVLASRLDTLVDAGIFPRKTAEWWLKCCEGNLPEWTQEVIDSLPDYASSGEEVREKIDKVLEAPVFTKAEQTIWKSYANEAGYQEMLAALGTLEGIKKNRENERKDAKLAQVGNNEAKADKVRLAIRAGRLDEADEVLRTLDPKDSELVYRRLEQMLAEAKSERAIQQFDQAWRATAA